MEILKILTETQHLFLILLILLELIVVVLIGIVIRVERSRRLNLKKKRAQYKNAWMEALVDLSMGFELPDSILKSLTSKKLKKEFRDSIVTIAQSLSLKSRPALVKLYIQQGYLERDHKALNSFSFAKRLQAMARIEVMQDDSSLPYLDKLIHDRNYYIRFASLKFIVRKDANRIPAFEQVFQTVMDERRKDSLLEFLITLAAFQRPLFVSTFQGIKGNELKKEFLKVVHSYKITECLPLVRGSLKELILSESQDVLLIKSHLLCLTIEPDLESEKVLEDLKNHPKLEVRFLALCSLLVLRPELKDELYNSLNKEEVLGLHQAFENFSIHLGAAAYG